MKIPEVQSAVARLERERAPARWLARARDAVSIPIRTQNGEPVSLETGTGPDLDVLSSPGGDLFPFPGRSHALDRYSTNYLGKEPFQNYPIPDQVGAIALLRRELPSVLDYMEDRTGPASVRADRDMVEKLIRRTGVRPLWSLTADRFAPDAPSLPDTEAGSLYRGVIRAYTAAWAVRTSVFYDPNDKLLHWKASAPNYTKTGLLSLEASPDAHEMHLLLGAALVGHGGRGLDVFYDAAEEIGVPASLAFSTLDLLRGGFIRKPFNLAEVRANPKGTGSVLGWSGQALVNGQQRLRIVYDAATATVLVEGLVLGPLEAFGIYRPLSLTDEGKALPYPGHPTVAPDASRALLPGGGWYSPHDPEVLTVVWDLQGQDVTMSSGSIDGTIVPAIVGAASYLDERGIPYILDAARVCATHAWAHPFTCVIPSISSDASAWVVRQWKGMASGRKITKMGDNLDTRGLTGGAVHRWFKLLSPSPTTLGKKRDGHRAVGVWLSHHIVEVRDVARTDPESVASMLLDATPYSLYSAGFDPGRFRRVSSDWLSHWPLGDEVNGDDLRLVLLLRHLSAIPGLGWTGRVPLPEFRAAWTAACLEISGEMGRVVKADSGDEFGQRHLFSDLGNIASRLGGLVAGEYGFPGVETLADMTVEEEAFFWWAVCDRWVGPDGLLTQMRRLPYVMQKGGWWSSGDQGFVDGLESRVGGLWAECLPPMILKIPGWGGDDARSFTHDEWVTFRSACSVIVTEAMMTVSPSGNRMRSWAGRHLAEQTHHDSRPAPEGWASLVQARELAAEKSTRASLLGSSLIRSDLAGVRARVLDLAGHLNIR